ALLQILDDGRMTDGQGRTVDFKNAIVIMTSNIGSQWITDLGGREHEEMERRVLEALRAHFKPEFLNRIDDIIIFHALSREHLQRIVDLQVDLLNRRLAEHKLSLELTDGAKEYLAREGWDPVYGARPLKRAVQRNLLDHLSLALLEGRFKEEDVIRVRTGAEGLVFERA
ncbi:MAG: AAA family ATPase, partial [Thermodesulfobacteriota bacterium]